MTALPEAAPPDPLDYALRYARCGLRVVPIMPGQKRPDMQAWQDAATTERSIIEGWWTGLYRGHGVGIALGELVDYATTSTYTFAVDIDEHGVSGGDTWHDLCATHGEPPDTAEAITGGGGRHLLFSSSTEIRNGSLGPGVDIRGAGGQIVVEPTVHPSGVPYQWADGAAPWERDIAVAPQWIIDALTRPEPAPAPTAAQPPRDVGERPGDIFAAQTSWADLLGRYGWQHSHTDATGEDYWTRPGKEVRDGVSATVGHKGSDVLKVFTSSIPQLTADATYSKIGFLAAMEHGGSIAAAASALAGAGYRLDDLAGFADVVAVAPTSEGATMTTDDAGGWPIATADDIRSVLSGNYQPPMPDVMLRSDGLGMLYRSRVNSLAGEPGGGKTWIALHAAAEVLADGGAVVLIDYEDRLDTAVRRLRALGAAPDAIVARFTYVTPTHAIRGGHVPTNVLAQADRADLAIIDSMGEALAHSELDQNVDQEVRAWIANTARRLADGGAAVLVLDHVTKDSEHRGRWAIGSQRKLAAIDGVAYMMATLTAATKETEGRAVIKCSKDRLGNYQHGTTVADVRLIPDGDGMAVTLTAPATEGGEELLTGYMERISRFLEGVGEEMSGRAIEGSVTGAGRHIRTALKQLVDLGHVVTLQGKSGAVIHRLDVPFREFDSLETGSASPRPHRVPTASGRGAQTPESTASPRPPLKGDADAVGDGGSSAQSDDDPPRPLDDEIDDTEEFDFI